MIAVGAVDLYFKNLWTEIPIAYLYGLLEPPGKIRTEISSVVARLVLDSVRNDVAGNITSAFHNLAVAEHRRSLEKRIFKGTRTLNVVSRNWDSPSFEVVHQQWHELHYDQPVSGYIGSTHFKTACGRSPYRSTDYTQPAFRHL